MQYVVEAAGLTRRFGSVEAVRDLHLRVARGEIYGLVGPDGAGKTTTVRMIAGAVRPTSGSVRIAGLDALSSSDKVKQRVGCMSQRFTLYEDLTVKENLDFFADVYRVPKDVRGPRAQRLLAFSRLDPFRDRLAQHLSGGMKQKLALACTLIHNPEVLLLDEPTAGVDPVSRREFWQILHELVSDGVTILCTTPYMDEAERCTRLSFLSEGRQIAADTPARLKSLFHATVLEVEARPQFTAQRAIAQLPGVRDVQRFGNRLHVIAESPAVARLISPASSHSDFMIESLREIAPSLEDVFMKLTGSWYEMPSVAAASLDRPGVERGATAISHQELTRQPDSAGATV